MAESVAGVGRRTYQFDEMAINITERAEPTERDSETYVGLEHLDSGSLTVRRWGTEVDLIGTKLRMQKGDVLFGKRNAYLRRVALAPHEGLFSAHGMVLRAKSDIVLPEFLPFFMQSDLFMERAKQISVGSLSPTINWKTLAKQQFTLPPLEEQRRIVAVLIEAETYKGALTDSALRAAAVEESLFWSFITKGATYQMASSSHIGPIPTVWPLIPISDVAEVAYGISAAVSSNTDPAIGWPILTGANISLSGEIDLHKLVYHKPPSKDAFILRKGDVLLNWRSGSPAHVGKAALFELDGSWTYASFLLRVRTRPDLNNRYLWRLLNFMRKHQLFSRSTSHQVNFKMNAAYFREVQIPCPSRRIQDEVVDLLLPFWSIAKQLESRDSRVRLLTATVLNESNEASI